MTTSQPEPTLHTSIPPTNDAGYWHLKSEKDKTRIFVPRDRELHRELLIKQRSRKVVAPLEVHIAPKLRLGPKR